MKAASPCWTNSEKRTEIFLHNPCILAKFVSRLALNRDLSKHMIDASLQFVGLQEDTSVYELLSRQFSNRYFIISHAGTRRLMAFPEVVGYDFYLSMLPPIRPARDGAKIFIPRPTPRPCACSSSSPMWFRCSPRRLTPFRPLPFCGNSSGGRRCRGGSVTGRITRFSRKSALYVLSPKEQ